MRNPLVTETVNRRAYLPCVDPRVRIVAAVLLSLMVALSGQLAVSMVALACGMIAVAFSGVFPKVVVRRLLPVNLLVLLLAVVLPLTTPGQPLFRIGSAPFSESGFLLAGTIALKANAIVLILLAMLGSIDAITFGHALNHLRVPDKLTHLLLFTVRYMDVLRREYLRLRCAMRVRAFRPRMTRHTYRSYGYLAGMLLVRSFDRADRVVAAMKCRGFRGHFFMFDHFASSRNDIPFCVASAAVLAAMILLEWTVILRL